MKWILGILSITGLNFAFWALIGLVRMIGELSERLRTNQHPRAIRVWPLVTLLLLTCFGYLGTWLAFNELLPIQSNPLKISLVSLITAPPDLKLWPDTNWPYLLILGFSILTGYLFKRIGISAFQQQGLPLMVPYILTIISFLILIIFTDGVLNGIHLIAAALALAIIGVIAGIIFAEVTTQHYSQSALLVPSPHSLIPADVAVILAAHNEELTIGDTIRSLCTMLPRQNIFIGSDASSDKTVNIVSSLGIPVLDIQTNRGKAKTLVALLEYFKIFDRFKAVMIVDADIVMSPGRLDKLLPMFDDPSVAAAVGRAVPKWENHFIPRWNMFITAYRIRVWRSLQYGLRMGQTWKRMNVTPIIPGGSSIYRSSVLRQLQIDAPGLEIEDFNMTFEVHHKKLGRIAYNSAATIIDQEPYNFRDFIIQVKRWYLGFWQTVWRHGFWPSWFWFTMAAFTLEMYMFSLVLTFLPIALVMLAMNGFAPIQIFAFSGLTPSLQQLTLSDILIGIFLVDYAVTIIIALFERKPVLMLYGLGFIFLRYLDALMFAYSLPLSFFKRSRGQWKPPQRQAYTTPTNTNVVTSGSR